MTYAVLTDINKIVSIFFVPIFFGDFKDLQMFFFNARKITWKMPPKNTWPVSDFRFGFLGGGSVATRLWWWWEIHLRSTILRHCRRFARCFLRRTTGDLFERHGLWGRVTGFRGVKVVEIWGFQGWSNKMRFVFSKKQSDDLMGPTGIESWVGRLIQMIEMLTWCTTSSSWWGSLLSILF